MATFYVNSAAVGTGDGTSWANAATSFTNLLGLGTVVAGDDVDVAYTHSESSLGSLSFVWPGTAAAPNRIFSCDTTNAPALASDLRVGASILTSLSNNITWNGSFYLYGVTMTTGAAATGASLNFISTSNPTQVLDSCTLVLLSTGSGARINLASLSQGELTLINTTVSFGATGQSIAIGGRVRWYDTASAIGGAIVPTNLIVSSASSSFLLSGIDLSAVTSGNTLVASTTGPSSVLLLNCKLASGVTVAATPASLSSSKVDLVNCDSGATGYRQERYWYSGTLTTSTTVYNNATDGDTPISWQVVTTANAKQVAPFECFEIVQWVAAGTYANSVIQITSATAALTNADIWAECQVLNNASFPLASLVSSGTATQLTAGSSLAAGTWAHGGAGNDYQLSIPSFTVAIDGYVRFVVKVAKASLTAYIDPAVTVAA